MTVRHTIIALACALASHTVIAADWTIEQTATIAAAQANLSQTSTSGSHQAINGARLTVPADSITQLTQSVTLTGSGAFQLTQDGTPINNSVQAVNLAIAEAMDDVSQSATKTTGGTTLEQNITAGTGNIQAINFARANGAINNASQTFTGAALTLQKSANTPAGNLQAVNYAQAARYAGTVTQTVTVDSLTHLNRPGNAAEIRINSLTGDTTTATVQQSVIVAGAMVVDPAADTTVIINYREE